MVPLFDFPHFFTVADKGVAPCFSNFHLILYYNFVANIASGGKSVRNNLTYRLIYNINNSVYGYLCSRTGLGGGAVWEES